MWHLLFNMYFDVIAFHVDNFGPIQKGLLVFLGL